MCKAALERIKNTEHLNSFVSVSSNEALIQSELSETLIKEGIFILF